MTGGEGGGWAAAVLGFVEGWFWIADPGLRRGRNDGGGRLTAKGTRVL